MSTTESDDREPVTLGQLLDEWAADHQPPGPDYVTEAVCASRDAYPTFGDDPARWGLLPEPPMAAADLDAAAEAEAWGPDGSHASYAEWAADADQVTASPLALGREYEHGKATAWQMTERSAEGGRSADHIEQQHDELSGPARDQAERTPAESSWWSGYKSGADGSVSMLRELEKEDELEAG